MGANLFVEANVGLKGNNGYIAPSGCSYIPKLPWVMNDPEGQCVCDPQYGHNATEWEKYKTAKGPTRTFNDYQDFAVQTALYPDRGNNLVYPAMGLVGESGEFCDKVKKNWRNNNEMSSNNLSDEERLEFAKELGDVLWYAAAAAKELRYTLDEIASLNIKKLQDRRARGVIKSEGDNR